MEAATLRTPRPQASEPSDVLGPAVLAPVAMAAFDRLHATVRLAAEHLFPQGRGSVFMARLVQDADIKQVDLPGLGLVEACVVCLSSIEAFARGHGQSKDTASRYLAILVALKIVFRARHAGCTELCLPLTPWTPSPEALAALAALQAQDAARAKLRQLAQSVHTRVLLLYGTPAAWLSLYDDLQGTLAELAEQLARRVGATKRALLQARITNLQHRLCGPEGDCLRAADPRKPAVMGQALLQARAGDGSGGASGTPVSRHAHQGDVQLGPGSRNSSSSAHQGDGSTRQHNAPGLLLAHEGDLAAVTCRTHAPGSLQERDVSTKLRSSAGQTAAQRGDLAVESCRIHARGPAHQGDVQPPRAGQHGVAHAQEGDLSSKLPGFAGPVSTQEGDFQGGQDGTDGLISPPKGDFGMTRSRGQPIDQAEKGDFQEASVTPTFNVNVITLSYDTTGEENVNVNDSQALASMTNSEDRYTQQEAVQVGCNLAQFLEPNLDQMTPEQQRRTIGGFVNKCKNCSRTTVRAAVIDVLVHAHFPLVDPGDTRGVPNNHGAWFHGACDRYGVPGMQIPAFVQKWLVTDLSWKAIEETLRDAATRYQAAMLSGRRSGDLVRRWLRGELSQQELDEAVRQGEAVQGKQRQHGDVCEDWMDEDEAERVASRIQRDGATYGITDAMVRRSQGTFVVDLFRDGKRSLTLKHPAEWTDLLEALQLQAVVQEHERK